MGSFAACASPTGPRSRRGRWCWPQARGRRRSPPCRASSCRWCHARRSALPPSGSPVEPSAASSPPSRTAPAWPAAIPRSSRRPRGRSCSTPSWISWKRRRGPRTRSARFPRASSCPRSTRCRLCSPRSPKFPSCGPGCGSRPSRPMPASSPGRFRAGAVALRGRQRVGLLPVAHAWTFPCRGNHRGAGSRPRASAGGARPLRS